MALRFFWYYSFVIYWSPTGNNLDFSEETLGYVHLEDLIWSLGRERRFSNAIDWTVLEHSLAVGLAAEMLYGGNVPLIQWCYFHDFHEAVIRDIPTPFKRMVGENFYKAEEEIQMKLLKALNVSTQLGDDDYSLFKMIDHTMVYIEAKNFMNGEAVDILKDCIENVHADIIIACAEAFRTVYNNNLVDNGNINEFDEITNKFRSVIFSQV